MGKIKEYIDKIVINGRKEDMETLGNIFEEAMNKVKYCDEECYKKYKRNLIGMAYNYEFDEDMAKEIVEDMKPRGEYWDIDTTNQVRNQYATDVNYIDFYIVMNSLVNDYGSIINPEDVETYAKMTRAFIKDEDANKNKVWKYFTTIPKED